MKYIWFICLLILFIACKQQPLQQTTAQRIISLSPHVTEIIYALGQQKKLIAVSDFCNYPPQANAKEHIGGLLNPNLEKLLGLKATLFIGTPASYDLATKLEAQHIRTVLLPNDRLNDLFRSIDSIGVLLNCKKEAIRLSQTIHDSLNQYASLSRQLKSKPLAVLVIGRDPGSVRKITISGGSTFLSEIWGLIGGQNIFSSLAMKYSQISKEALLDKNPDLIIEFKFKEEWNADRQRQNLNEWEALNRLKAVQQKNLFVLTGDYTLIPGPRIYKLAADYYQIMKKYNIKMKTTL